jgi:carbon storage regulator CsrA
MLVLSRKPGEVIHVGPDIVIRLDRCDGNRARIAIYAPPNVVILRGELLDEFARLKEHAPGVMGTSDRPLPTIPGAAGEVC